MKTNSLWMSLSILFFFNFVLGSLQSCSTQDEIDFLEIQNESHSSPLLDKSNPYPENPTNNYDLAGRLVYDICENYYNADIVSETTSGTVLQVESFANLLTQFTAMLPAAYSSPTAGHLDAILTNQESTGLAVIANSNLSIVAKASLTNFMIGLMAYRDAKVSYDVIYNYIISYEASVISASGLTAIDRKIVLTATSISRYGFYFAKKHRRKPRDRDWEISWGHIIAGIDGVAESTAKAVIMAATANLIENK